MTLQVVAAIFSTIAAVANIIVMVLLYQWYIKK